jgi:hypothetical protein
MNQERKWSPDDLTDYVDRLVEMQLEMNELRKEAASHGLKPPALNWLVGQRAGNPSDGGAANVNELLQYALALDMPLEGVNRKPEDETCAEQSADVLQPSPACNAMEPVTATSASMETLLAREDRWRLPFAARVVMECGLGLGLAGLVVWLLL